jgi:hypothetical protein
VIDGATGAVQALQNATLTGSDIREKTGGQYFTCFGVPKGRGGPYTQAWADEEAALSPTRIVNHRATALYGSTHNPIIYGSIIVAQAGVVP